MTCNGQDDQFLKTSSSGKELSKKIKTARDAAGGENEPLSMAKKGKPLSTGGWLRWTVGRLHADLWTVQGIDGKWTRAHFASSKQVAGCQHDVHQSQTSRGEWAPSYHLLSSIASNYTHKIPFALTWCKHPWHVIKIHWISLERTQKNCRTPMGYWAGDPLVGTFSWFPGWWWWFHSATHILPNITTWSNGPILQLQFCKWWFLQHFS